MELVLRYREALDWIHGLGRFGINPGLERVSALLHLLDNPHHKVCFVHIAGTNGKGSTAAMLASILRASGYCTGLYTSPYLLSFTNRMAVNGSDVAREDLVELVDLVRPLVERIGAEGRLGQPTEFEVVTVLAMLYFARRQVDLVVLETGLGGRLDATNVVNPLVSIITNVSLDHMEVLGDTVEAIAGEKAGIIKRGIPLLTASDDQRVLEVIQSRCLQMGAAFYRVISSPKACLTKTFGNPAYALQSVAEHGQEFAYCGFQWQKHNLFIPLRGVYQVSNAATALAAAELLAEKGFEFTDARVRQGLAETNWPGRLEL
ncbi:MAG TPA: Mur ligase family protein, partial [Candidatus Limnocylindrales bacterium]|nr:Mur ligase family protein [Candidatus Limnocylindrales bacterium]